MKTMTLAILAALLFAQGAAAQEAAYTDEGELEAFITPFGAKMRMLQLKAAAQRNVMVGEAVLGEVDGLEIAQLASGIEGLKSIVEQIDEYDYETPQKEIALDFVAMKRQARQLTSMFRQNLCDSVGEQKAQRLRNMVQEGGMGQFKADDPGIAQARNMHNMHVTRRIMQGIVAEDDVFTGESAQDLKEKPEIMHAIRGRLSALENEGIANAMQKVEENLAKNHVIRQAVAEHVGQNLAQATQKRQAALDTALNAKAIREKSQKAKELTDSGRNMRGHVEGSTSSRQQDATEKTNEAGQNQKDMYGEHPAGTAADHAKIMQQNAWNMTGKAGDSQRPGVGR